MPTANNDFSLSVMFQQSRFRVLGILVGVTLENVDDVDELIGSVNSV